MGDWSSLSTMLPVNWSPIAAGPWIRRNRGTASHRLLPNQRSFSTCIANSVVVVEGFFDCMKVHQAGVRSVVGLMGSARYEPQRQALLEKFGHVILFLDGDSTGRKASTIIAQKLRPHCHVRVVLLPDRVQPDQLPVKDIENILQPSANDD